MDVGERYFGCQLLRRFLWRNGEPHRPEQQTHSAPHDLPAVGPGQRGELLRQRRAADDEPDARVPRGGLRHQYLANRGADPVRPDEQVSGCRIAPREPGFDPAIVQHVVPGQRGPGVHGESGQQQVPENLPVNHDPAPGRAEFADLVQLGVQGQSLNVGVTDDRVQQRVQALWQAAAQRLESDRIQYEPVPLKSCGDRRIPLVHVGLDPGTTQTLRQAQTPQTGSDHGNSHHMPPEQTVRTLLRT
ncbi:hypothetical protein ADK64_37060 [Streptomyces sp. MMG1121]|nr:hypothetical protein ADK64_37060 [Streptomyces sp. MMG1121]